MFIRLFLAIIIGLFGISTTALAQHEVKLTRDENKKIWEDETADPKERLTALRGICETYFNESHDTVLVLGKLLVEYSKETQDSTMMAMSMLSQARYISLFSNWQGDTTFIQQIKSLLPGIKDTSRSIDAIIYIASSNRHLGNFEESMKYARQSLTLSKRIKYKRGIRGSLHMIGLIYRSQAQMDSTLHYFQAAIKVTKEEGDEFKAAHYENDLAKILLRTGQYDEALRVTKKIINNWKEEEDQAAELLAACYFRVGRLYELREQVPLALNEYLRSLDIAEKYNLKKIKVAIQSALSDLYTALDDFEKAIEYKLIVLDYVEKQEHMDPNNHVTALVNIGIVYQHFNKSDSLIEHYFSAAYDMADSVGNIKSKAFTSINLGNYYMEKGNLEEAGKLLHFGLDVYEKEGATFKLQECYTVMSMFYHKKKAHDKRRMYAQKSEALCIENGFIGGHVKLMELLYTFEKELGNTQEALKYHEKHRTLKDSMNKSLKSAEVAKIHYQYEDSIQQIKNRLILAKEQALMKSELQASRFRTLAASIGGALFLLLSVFIFTQYQKVRKARKQVEASLEKEKAISMALVQEQARVKLKSLTKQMDPHFMFNSLQSISHYVVENDRKSANKYLVSFARLMRQSLNYSQKDYMYLEDEIELLNTYLELERLRFGMGFEYEIQLADNLDPSAIEIPPMFIQPHVENAVWHGMRHRIESPGSFIQLSFHQQEDYLICQIIDNGIGREATKQLNQQIRKGHQSISGDNMEERIALINSLNTRSMLLHTDNAFDNDPSYPGTKVTIQIPI